MSKGLTYLSRLRNGSDWGTDVMRYKDTAYIEYGNVKISNIGYRDVRDVLIKTIQHNERGYVCLNDVGNIYAATKDEGMRSAINGSLLSLADGAPLAW